MGRTILIVEDDELNMKLFNDLLQADGYDTLQTRDGLEVVAIASEHKPDRPMGSMLVCSLFHP